MVGRDVGLVVERAVHGAFEDGGIEEGLTMSVRHRARTGRELDDGEVNVLPAGSGRGLLEQGGQSGFRREPAMPR
jgi:hypothetical protein